MKKRIITLTLSVLAVVLLVGVGFASWVVSQGAESNQTGNILVETVKDERLAVTVTPDGTKFQFGAPANATQGWLTEDGEDAVLENLTVSFTVVVTRDQAFVLEDGQPSDLNMTLDFSDKLVDGDAAEHDYPEALIQQVGATFAAAVAGASKWDLSNENKTATTVVTLELDWGTLFNGQNPYEFFNQKSGENYVRPVDGNISAAEAAALNAAGLQWNGADFTEDNNYGDYAVAALRAIYALNNYQFKLTITLA